MHSYKNFVKPSTPVLQSTRVLDQLRERIRYMHYSLSTEQVYVYWVRFFIRWSGHGGAMRHPREMGASDVEAFLTHLATDRKVSASTHNQALSAILFLYREVLAIELPWLNGINRPTQKRRIPSVLTKDEVAGLLAQMDGVTALIARLLYGTGMRLMEGMRPCVCSCRRLAHSGKLIGRRSAAAWKRPMRLSKSIPRSVLHGLGSGCFHHPLSLSIREAAWNGATICTKTGCSAR